MWNKRSSSLFSLMFNSKMNYNFCLFLLLFLLEKKALPIEGERGEGLYSSNAFNA